MKIRLLVIGKTTPKYWLEVLDEYSSRLVHYTKFSVEHLPDVKRNRNTLPTQLKEQEAGVFMKKLNVTDFVVLLDEKGKSYSSEKFAKQLSSWQNKYSSIVFIAGGAYGFGEQMYARANHLLSLSSMTFSHQMVRAIFIEQLYRAFTIIKGEPYHHK